MSDRHTYAFGDIREIPKIPGTHSSIYFFLINIKIDQIIITEFFNRRAFYKRLGKGL